jgi:hypothetical protein
VQMKQKQQHQPLNIPTLCNDGLTLNQPFSTDFFEVVTFSRDDTDAPFKPRRRVSLLSNNDDHHVPLKAKDSSVFVVSMTPHPSHSDVLACCTSILCVAPRLSDASVCSVLLVRPPRNLFDATV